MKRIPANRAGIAVAMIALMVGLWAAPASAHAAYKDSSPADKSTVSSPPTEVWAEFTEPPESSEASRLEIYDPCGVRVDSGGTTTSGYRMTTTMSADKQGQYTVLFQVVSALDGHPTKGQFTFTSTGGAPCPGAEEEPDTTGSEEQPDEDTSTEEESGSDEPFTVAGGGGDKPFDPVDALKHHKDKKGKHGKHSRNEKKIEKKQRTKDEPVVQAAETPSTTPASDSREIPMDWLLISFGVAALIGAAGGQVYVNLLGPKR